MRAASLSRGEMHPPLLAQWTLAADKVLTLQPSGARPDQSARSGIP